MLTYIADWMDHAGGCDYIWYIKRLSGNDTLANGAHQAGPYIPKKLLFSLFPLINKPDLQNPSVWFDLYVDSHADCRNIRAVWYNNKLHGGTRNEARLTNFGGHTSPLLDPESTGALTVFAFRLDGNGEAIDCHVWVCRNPVEENLVEDCVGQIEPGQWKIWTSDESRYSDVNIEKDRKKHRESCWLEKHEIPELWLSEFPSGIDIVKKTVELKPSYGFDPDIRLIKRRDCEFEIFRSVEEIIELDEIIKGFLTIDEFISKAQTILQRRKARSGRSLELQTREIFIEEGLKENEDFSHQPESDLGKHPDFLFPSGKDYKNPSFSPKKLRMLAVKTTCKDRWRQILNEANRIDKKHLLTLQEGISENQFREMVEAGVQLVVPSPRIPTYPKSVQPHLQTLESFIGDLRILKM